MKKVLSLITILLGSLIVGLLLPGEWRGKLSRPLAARIERYLERMPDG